MKKMTMQHETPPTKRALRLSKEAIRTLGSDELSQAVSGCDTTSWTTEKPDAKSGI